MISSKEKNKNNCCNNPKCTCPAGQCKCQGDCDCGNTDSKQNTNFQQYEYSKTESYQNIGGKQQAMGQQIKRRMINNDTQQQILRQKLLPNGKTLVTRQILEDGCLKKVEQYVRTAQGKQQMLDKENMSKQYGIGQ